jgi:hypothetical protein
MTNSPLPTPLLELGARRFSFYPPIRNLDHNEWQYRRATWNEVVVVNTQTGEEALIPRACVGEVSIIDHPVVIVGLRRELEWRGGAVYPHRRPVIEFPLAVNGDVNGNIARAPHPERPAPVVNIRLEARPASRKSRKIAVAVMLGSVGCLIGADLVREIQVRQRVRIAAGDDYSSIVARLGTPASERSVAGYRLLAFPKRRLTVVLAGQSRYIGTLDSGRRVVDTVTLPDGTNSANLLRSLPPF